MARALPIPGLDVEKPILLNASLIVETRLAEMLNYEPFLQRVECVYELHQMRIAAKRLRYSMEIFQPLIAGHTPYGKEFANATEQIKSLQEHLGVIHDADVLVPRLEEHMARLLKPGYGENKNGELRTGVDLVDLEGCQGLLTLCTEVRDERAARYLVLVNDWNKYRESHFFENLVSLIKIAAGLTPEPVPVEAQT